MCVCVKGVWVIFDETSNSFNYFSTPGVVLIIHSVQPLHVSVCVFYERWVNSPTAVTLQEKDNQPCEFIFKLISVIHQVMTIMNTSEMNGIMLRQYFKKIKNYIPISIPGRFEVTDVFVVFSRYSVNSYQISYGYTKTMLVKRYMAEIYFSSLPCLWHIGSYWRL